LLIAAMGNATLPTVHGTLRQPHRTALVELYTSDG
jgi:hypothetical protein